jgi:elongation factor 2
MHEAGEKRFMSTGQEEIKRGITIKSSGVSLYFELQDQGKPVKEGYLFNVIDSPGHVDFSSEVTAALRVTDGALVVVDSVEGVCVQTETVLRQALQEKIKPVLFINKIDRLIQEQEVDGETMYKGFVKTIENFNVIVATCEHEDMGSLEAHPVLGNVAFGSGKDCWAFTLNTFARVYADKLNVDPALLVQKFWGDNYYDKKAKLWRTEPFDAEGKPLTRGFVEFILDPILQIANLVKAGNKEKLAELCLKKKVELSAEDWELSGKALNKLIMRRWLDAADCILEMMVRHLPSPKTAQKYRYSYLYEGDKDDPAAIAIRDCDINGPLMMYVSKMIPSNDGGRFYAFGRVFSGKVSTGQKVRLLGSNYSPGQNHDVHHTIVQRTVLMMGKKTEQVQDIPCGNTGALVGIDKYLKKNGTVTDSQEAHNIRAMKFSVSPVVRIALQPKNPQELPKLIEGMRKLSQIDQLIQCHCDEQTGQNILAGSGALHLEICISDLVNELANIEIIQSNPLVSYCETVTTDGEICMAKSSNKHNRVYCCAEPLPQELAYDIERGVISRNMETKDLSKLLVTYGLDKSDAQRVWAFGPNDDGPNLFLETTTGCSYLKEVKDSAITGFNLATAAGVMCEEQTRAIRFNLNDLTAHSDPAHRGTSQLIPTFKRALYASQLAANPRLQEPIYCVEIICPNSVVGTVYSVISMKRGSIEEEIETGIGQSTLKGFMPVAESFGFTEYLREQTSGKAFPSLSFHHWEVLNENPLSKAENRVTKIVTAIRKRKGLKEQIPLLEELRDKA